MPKVLIISPGLKMGGAENSSVNFANGLKNHGCEVTFVSLFKQVSFFRLNEGISFYEPVDFNVKKLHLFRTLFWLRKTARTENPDAIIVFQKFYSAITILSLIGTRYKILISERSSPLFKWALPVTIFNKIVFSIRKPDGIIAQTSIAAVYQRKYYGNKVPVKVIPNIVRDIKLFPEIERENFILAVGRLNDYLKGFDRLIEAMALLKNDWPLYLAGGDNECKELKQLAKKLGVEHKVRFPGKIKEIDELYARAGLFVIPSRSEGFPNALCEAMAAGCCCVAFNFVAGPEEIIKNEVNGFLIEDGNIQHLADMMDYLIDNEKVRIEAGTKAAEIKEMLSSKIIAGNILNFIYEVWESKI